MGTQKSFPNNVTNQIAECIGEANKKSALSQCALSVLHNETNVNDISK